MSTLRVILLFSAAVACAPAGMAGEAWVEMGPAPITSGPFSGRCSAIATSPTNANKYFVAAASGGVWRTLNGGSTWTPLTDDLPINSIGALTLDPANEDIIYAGSGEATFANHSFYGQGLYKSIDGGDSWTVLAADTFGGRTFSRIVVSHADAQVLFASIMHAGGFPARNAAKGHPLMNDAVGVYRSLDGGASWSLLTGGLPATAASDIWMDPTNADVLYAAIGDIFGPPENGIFKSTDGGNSWAQLSGGALPTTNVGRTRLAIAPTDPQRIYAFITNPSSSTGGGATTRGIFRSDDGGSTWLDRSPGNIQATYGWYLCILLVDPLDADTVIAGGLSLVRSTNGGSNWTTITAPHVDNHGLAYDASHRLLCACDGGVFRSSNNGTSWSDLNDGLGVIQFYPGLSAHPGDETFVLAGFQDNGSNRREGSVTWTQRLGGDGGYTALNPISPNSVWAEFQGSGNLFFSTNGGDSFNFRGSGIVTSDRNCFLPPFAYSPGSSTTLFYGTHRVYRSTTTGSSWFPISGDITGGGSAAIRSLTVAPSNDQTLYAATNDGRVLTSTNGGFNWTLTLSGVPGWPRTNRQIAVDPDDDAAAYLAVSQFGVDQVLRTADWGGSWIPMDGDLPDIPANTVAVYRDGDHLAIFVGTDNGVFMSVDHDTEWSLFGEGMPHSPIMDLVVDTAFNRLLAGTMGRGMWSVPLPDLAAGDVPTTSSWSLGIMTLVILAIGVWRIRHRRQA